MALTALLLALTLSFSGTTALAVPVLSLNSSSGASTPSTISWVTETVISRVRVLETATRPTKAAMAVPVLTAVESVLFFPQLPFSVSATSESLSRVSPPQMSSVWPSLPRSLVITTTSIEILTSTKTITDPPTTITVLVSASASTATVIDIITVFISSPALPSATPDISSSKTTWSAPAKMTDLGPFNISAFPGGQRNLEIVNGIPANASATSVAAAAATAADISSSPLWDNSSSVLQLLYPANSINPGRKPQGGAEFYATPLHIATARNITLEYSVFFPANFDWVLAGKLPGLYGGHTGCSGGDEALDCFSTRLMWRKGGFGELYLYAPKYKQTTSLCSDPRSVCDAAYGLSIGRGSFAWAAGAWTNVRQTVALNTPGKQDGTFALDVNGKRVVERDDVFYRDVPPPTNGGIATAPSPWPAKTITAIHGGGDPFGSLLGGILRRVDEEEYAQGERPSLLSRPTPLYEPRTTDAAVLIAMDAVQTQRRWALGLALAKDDNATTTVTATTTVKGIRATVTATANNVGFLETTKTVQATSTAFPALLPITMQSFQRGGQPIGFIGLFFSTFFGGHEQQYATPMDQHVWFKDFAMSFNS